MTAIEKVLLRKDISSIIVAIIVGTAVTFFLASVTGPLTTFISFNDQFQGNGVSAWDFALQGLVSFVLQVVALELLLRVVIFARAFAYKKNK